MTNLRRRLRILEAHLSDESRLVPHSPQWRAYWTDWVKKRLQGEEQPRRIPVDAYRAVIDTVVAAHPDLRQ